MRTFSKPTLLVAAAASLAFPGAALAQTYGGLSAGIGFPETSKNKGEFTTDVPASATFPAIPNGTSLAWDTKFDTGYNISAQLGHRFEGGFRVEGELIYNRAGIKTHRGVTVGETDIDGIDASVLTRGAAVGSTVGQVVDSGIGKQESFGGFANAYYDFNAGGSFQPYVGGGIGLMRTKFDYRPSDIDVGQGSDTNFAWQLAAGATYKVSPGFELFGQYNYRDAGKTKLALDLLPADLNAKSTQSIVSWASAYPLVEGNKVIGPHARRRAARLMQRCCRSPAR
ncbi:MAG: porin family protein [Sphingopyxis sp.]|nr:porin family protein [Sphingopyxis sp.]